MGRHSGSHKRDRRSMKHHKKDRDRKTSGTERRKSKKRRHADRPKRPLTGYMLFCRETRAKLREAQPNLSFSEVGKQLGEMWKSVPDDEKKRLNQIVSHEKEKYRHDMAEYRNKHPQSSSDEDDKPQKKKRRKRKDANAPKRPLSAFFHFSAAKRPSLRSDNPGLKFGELGKILGEQWRALDPDTRAPYQRLAEADRIRYESEYATYRANRPKSPPPSSSSSSSSSSSYSSSSSSDSSSSSSSSSSYSSSSGSESESSSYSSSS